MAEPLLIPGVNANGCGIFFIFFRFLVPDFKEYLKGN